MASRVRALSVVALLAGVPSLAFEASAQSGPQTVVRRFCEADAHGNRVSIQGWTRVAPLVEWPLEPAWDHAFLITSYTVGWPVPADEDTLSVEVRYAVMQEVSAGEIKDLGRIDSVTFRVRASEGASWRIVGPPPAPYIFQQEVDAEALRLSLERGGLNFLPNSLFITQMMRAAGWEVPQLRIADLVADGLYLPVREPRVGDLVVYLRDGIPYHAGLLETEESVVSSTLNGGILRTPVDGFSGDMKVLRLARRPVAPTVEPTEKPEEESPEPGRFAPRPPLPTPTPAPKAAKSRSPQLTRAGKTPPRPTPGRKSQGVRQSSRR